MAVLWYGIWFWIGASIFSFLNVVAFRVPKELSFVKGHSFCPSCDHRLGMLDLIPVLSWFGLRGRCRYCKEKIPFRDTAVEIIGGLLVMFCAGQYLPLEELAFGMSWERWMQVIVVIAFLSVLTVVMLVDIDTMEIPNGFVIAVIVIAAVSILVFPDISLIERGIGAVVVSLPMLLLTLVVPGAFGGGDIKLMFACGLFLGWKLTLISFFFAVLLGGFYGIYLLIGKKKSKKEHFAFGPSLCIGMASGWFFGLEILNWYIGLFWWK